MGTGEWKDTSPGCPTHNKTSLMQVAMHSLSFVFPFSDRE